MTTFPSVIRSVENGDWLLKVRSAQVTKGQVGLIYEYVYKNGVIGYSAPSNFVVQ